MPQLRFILIALPLAALLVFAGCSSSDRTVATGGVQGVVLLAPQGGGTIPADAAVIRVQNTSLQTQANAQGQFQLSGIPVGTYTLLISHSGYAATSVPVQVRADVITPVANVTLAFTPRTWTVLVFMNADNDLEEYGIEDMNEMEQAPDSDRVTTLVQIDRSGGYDTSEGNWTGCRRYQVKQDGNPDAIGSTLLEEMGEVDMGQPTTLQTFIAWGKAAFPAERYLLVIWNHGSGWRSRTLTSEATRGVSFDDTSGTYIRTVDLPAALATDTPFDLIAFDASLMQMLEIAYEMRNTCAYLVGSEESPPGAGYHYQDWLTPLVDTPDMTPVQLGTLITQVTLTYYGANSDITQSVLDMAQLAPLATALDAFAASLITNADGEAAALAAARTEAEAFKFVEYKDLMHYATLVKAKASRATLRASADTLIAAASRAILANTHGSEHPDAYGVSIYIPTPSAYQAWVQSLYTPLALSQSTRWDQWLKAQVQ